jgi:non-specific serine/threonine protein kinase
LNGVFISYRREDSAGWTGRIYDRAVARLGRDRVFLDVETIKPGEDFSQAIEEILERVDAVFVVMGPGWLRAVDPAGRRRLDDPSDYVRRETAIALERGIRVIPVLVNGAGMPEPRDLPRDIRQLGLRNAISISDTRFDHDIGRLFIALGLSAATLPQKQRSNLPRQLTSFVGRDRELSEVAGLLHDHRLVTLTGAGGSGKTRLAIEAATEVQDDFPGGVWFADLSIVDDASLVSRQVASAVGVREVSEADVIDRVVSRLADCVGLLVLDNCEQVLDAISPLAAELLRQTDGVRVLATSREPLRISGEHSYIVPVLDTPGGISVGPTELADFSSAQLFCERAAVVRPGFQISTVNAPLIAQICHRLDGLPLALELAAARLDVLDLDDLWRRLDHGIGVLADRSRDAQPRQQTLAATLDWSYQLLTADERTALSRMSVFTGGFTLEATEEICSGDGIATEAMIDLLSSLVAKSLVVPYEGLSGLRFRFLETVREFAAARLADDGEREQLQRRHGSFYRRFAVEAPEHIWGPDEAAWLDRLDDEWPNIRRSLRWHFDSGHFAEGQLMAGALRMFYFRRYHRTEGVEWLRRFVEADQTPSRGRALALQSLANFADRSLWDIAIALTREQGTPADLATALNNSTFAALCEGDWETARKHNDEHFAVAQHTGDPSIIASAQGQAAYLAIADGDLARALSLLEEVMTAHQRQGSPERVVEDTRDLGNVQRYSGDARAAYATLLNAQKLEADLHGPHGFAGWTEISLAAVALDLGDTDTAIMHLLEYNGVVEHVKEDSLTWAVREKPLLEWARVAVTNGQHEIAVTLLGAQDSFKNEMSTAPRLHLPPVVAEGEQTLAKAKKHLSQTGFRKAWDRGQEMTAPEALNYALNSLKYDRP